MYEARHYPRDCPELEGVQTQQAADAEGGAHDREAGEAAEARAGKEAQAKASGEPYLGGRRRRTVTAGLKQQHHWFLNTCSFGCCTNCP